MYDFREGLEKDKIVYKNTRWDYVSFFQYMATLFATWTWTAGWFALFFYAYVYHEIISFWTFIACWLVFFAIMTTFVVLNQVRHKENKLKKKRKEEEIQRKKQLLEQYPKNRDQNEREGNRNNIMESMHKNGVLLQNGEMERLK